MSQTTTVRTVLRRALTNIQSGWCQGSNYRVRRGHAQYCARGAIFNADARRPYLVRAAVNTLKQAAGSDSIVEWNDKSGRTKTEVVNAFKKAITLA